MDKQLEKVAEKEVAVVSALQARANELKIRADELVIADDESVEKAKALIKEINAYKNEVEDKRKSITVPFNNIISQLIAKEKDVLLPLAEGKTSIGGKVIAYEEEKERKRKEEEQRIKDIVDDLSHFASEDYETVEEVEMNGAGLKEAYDKLSEADQAHPSIKVALMGTVGKLSERRALLEERARLEAERVRQAEAQKKLDEDREKQTAEEARLAAERKKNEDEKRENDEAAAQLALDKAQHEKDKELAKAQEEKDKLEKQQARTIKAAPKAGITTLTKFEVVDPEMVPRAYCSPDDSKIREAVKRHSDLLPVNIPGVRIYTEKKVR